MLWIPLPRWPLVNQLNIESAHTSSAMPVQAAKHPAVLHATKVRQASAAEDAPKLCCLYAGAPHMQRALLDLIMRRTRFSGLQSLTRAFAPGSVPVAFVCRVLGFVGRYCDGEAGEQALASGGETDAVGVLSGCSRAHFPGAYGPQARLCLLRHHVDIMYMLSVSTLCMFAWHDSFVLHLNM